MATIIEHGLLYTLTDEFAKVLEDEGKIKACDATHNEVMEYDLPIYHCIEPMNNIELFHLLTR